MPQTYTPIATTTVSGSTTQTVTFSSIPSTYTDLIVIINAGYTNNVGDDQFHMRINGDTGSNYSNTVLYGTGSAAGSYRDSNFTYMNMGRASRNDIATAVIVNLQNYANTTTNKSVLFTMRTADSSYAGANVPITSGAGLWRSTSAINSITFSNYYNTNYYRSGSTFTLYGIKAA